MNQYYSMSMPAQGFQASQQPASQSIATSYGSFTSQQMNSLSSQSLENAPNDALEGRQRYESSNGVHLAS